MVVPLSAISDEITRHGGISLPRPSNPVVSAASPLSAFGRAFFGASLSPGSLTVFYVLEAFAMGPPWVIWWFVFFSVLPVAGTAVALGAW